MREILFRGKRKDNGEWISGDLRQWSETSMGICDRDLKRTFPVRPETVGQFIGMPDKNGKKIFEGDIIENRGCRFVIGFENTAFAAMDGPDMQFAMFEQYKWDYKAKKWDAPGYWEVVGNIHDNPELLKGGAKDA